MCVRGLWAAILVAAATASHAAECRPVLLPSDAARLVKPLVKLRIEAARENAPVAGLDSGLEALLKVETRAGDQALAYMLTVYMGEGFGEALVCEVARRGKRMIPWVEAYARCRPLLGLEPLPEPVAPPGGDPKTSEALDRLRRGKRCVWGD